MDGRTGISYFYSEFPLQSFYPAPPVPRPWTIQRTYAALSDDATIPRDLEPGASKQHALGTAGSDIEHLKPLKSHFFLPLDSISSPARSLAEPQAEEPSGPLAYEAEGDREGSKSVSANTLFQGQLPGDSAAEMNQSQLKRSNMQDHQQQQMLQQHQDQPHQDQSHLEQQQLQQQQREQQQQQSEQLQLQQEQAAAVYGSLVDLGLSVRVSEDPDARIKSLESVYPQSSRDIEGQQATTCVRCKAPLADNGKR